MILVKQPSPRKLEKLARSGSLAGKTILHYTGGMFGIGCTVSSSEAIERIIKLKQRKDKHGLIVLVPDLKWFPAHDVEIPDRIRSLLEQYWPGNLTVVFPCDDPRFVQVAHKGKVAFRVPDDDLLRHLIELLDDPLISTSVNISNLPPENDLKRLTGFYASWFDYAILDGNSNVEYDSQPSTVVEFIGRKDPGNHSGTDELKCLREGSIPFYGIKRSFQIPTIMFVCTANICRSPIAEHLFKYYAHEEGLHMLGDSCGLLSGGQSISASSLQLLLERGLSAAQEHESKQVTPEMLTGSRLVLTMEERHRDYLLKLEPGLTHKIMTLNEYLEEPGDITDPFGSDLENYRKTFDIIEDRIKRLVARLKEQENPLVPENSHA